MKDAGISGGWQMMAWLQAYWASYNPLPRASIVTYRDGSEITTEALSQAMTGDASDTLFYSRDDLYLGGMLISSAVWSGTTPGWQFDASDHLGTPRLVSNTAAAKVEERQFWPYGDDGPITGGGAGQRLKLALMERDDETTHLYDHARYQGFTLGRFLTRDRVSGYPDNPQSWNRYSYVLGNPINLIDPYGLADSQSGDPLPCTVDPDGTQHCSDSAGVPGGFDPVGPGDPPPTSSPIFPYPFWGPIGSLYGWTPIPGGQSGSGGGTSVSPATPGQQADAQSELQREP